eukprot:TRINITY_DN42233_c0_g1_i1.p1 TRINITY_DN42233_c0_g1~~TRINITY_DN42233_c0_g1_i1.p1  ORF type:complete len:741 (+),score=99.87 TRINITY_DN42233_c0_g1_i1:72-2294(+)
MPSPRLHVRVIVASLPTSQTAQIVASPDDQDEAARQAEYCRPLYEAAWASAPERLVLSDPVHWCPAAGEASHPQCQPPPTEVRPEDLTIVHLFVPGTAADVECVVALEEAVRPPKPCRSLVVSTCSIAQSGRRFPSDRQLYPERRVFRSTNGWCEWLASMAYSLRLTRSEPITVSTVESMWDRLFDRRAFQGLISSSDSEAYDKVSRFVVSPGPGIPPLFSPLPMGPSPGSWLLSAEHSIARGEADDRLRVARALYLSAKLENHWLTGGITAQLERELLAGCPGLDPAALAMMAIEESRERLDREYDDCELLVRLVIAAVDHGCGGDGRDLAPLIESLALTGEHQPLPPSVHRLIMQRLAQQGGGNGQLAGQLAKIEELLLALEEPLALPPIPVRVATVTRTNKGELAFTLSPLPERAHLVRPCLPTDSRPLPLAETFLDGILAFEVYTRLPLTLSALVARCLAWALPPSVPASGHTLAYPCTNFAALPNGRRICDLFQEFTSFCVDDATGSLFTLTDPCQGPVEVLRWSCSTNSCSATLAARLGDPEVVCFASNGVLYVADAIDGLQVFRPGDTKGERVFAGPWTGKLDKRPSPSDLVVCADTAYVLWDDGTAHEYCLSRKVLREIELPKKGGPFERLAVVAAGAVAVRGREAWSLVGRHAVDLAPGEWALSGRNLDGERYVFEVWQQAGVSFGPAQRCCLHRGELLAGIDGEVWAVPLDVVRHLLEERVPLSVGEVTD